MKHALFLVLALAAVVTSGAPASARASSPTISASCCDPPVRWMPRHDSRDVRLAITTLIDEAMLVLTDEVVAVQLSDRTMRKVKRELRKEHLSDEDDDNVIASAIKTAIARTVESFLDHSAEVSVRDLRDVDYRDGRLVFTTEKGKEIFEDIEVNDDPLTSGFSERDARAFVREFRKVKRQTR